MLLLFRVDCKSWALRQKIYGNFQPIFNVFILFVDASSSAGQYRPNNLRLDEDGLYFQKDFQ